MNKIEKLVYDAVKDNPKVKSAIRNIYQSVYDLVPDKPNFSIKPLIVKEGYFFGFHDISPFSFDDGIILSNKLEMTENPIHMPTKEDLLTVGFWNRDLSVFTPLGTTYAWNFHKGCRLQWVGESCKEVAYNDVKGRELITSIISTNGLKKRMLDYPIDTISHNGKYATSFSYARLNKYMPGYGYAYDDSPYFNEAESDNTGLYLVDTSNNVRRLIVSLNALASIQHEPAMDGAYHYVTHTEFCPNDSRIAFLHRWTHDASDKRFTRLVTCKLDGTDIQISKTSGMVSHYCWDEQHGILAYCQVNGVDGHYIFDDFTMQNPTRVAQDLNSDGHQSYIPGTNMFVTDTYPDKRRYAKIYLSDIGRKKSEVIVEVKSPKKYQSPSIYKHWACDLHPRISPTGNLLCFDSVHTGKRALCIMKVNG